MIKLGKDPIDFNQQTNVIYKLSCLSCSKTYVGQTGRYLSIRCEEHKNNIRLNEKYHVITQQKMQHSVGDIFTHEFDFDNIKILHKENNEFKRLVGEMFFVKKEKDDSLNLMTDLKNYNGLYNVILDKFE